MAYMPAASRICGKLPLRSHVAPGATAAVPACSAPPTPPAAVPPTRLIVLETEGWALLDDRSKAGFAQLLERLQGAGVTLLRRSAHPWVEALEQAIANAGAICNAITGWENRWALRNLVDEHPDGVSQRAKNTLARAEAMSPEDYRAA